MWPFLLWK